MKKHLLILLLSFWVADVSMAQQWAAPSSVWRYKVYTIEVPAFVGLTTVTVEKDTVIDSQPCQKLIGNQQPYFTAPCYTYLSGDTVFFYFGGGFQPTYFFGAQVGDTLLMTCIGPVIDSPYHVRALVDSITLFPGALSLKTFHVSLIDSPYDHSGFYQRFTYTEKIGLGYGFVPYLFEPIGDGSTDFCNYGDSSLPGYWQLPETNCIIDSGQYANSITLYPVPSSDYVAFNDRAFSFNTYDYEITIYDTEGRRCFCPIGYNSLDIHALAQGMYIVRLTGFGQTIVRRFIKE